MPLTRYQIRSEYGLADPELYTAADKDDPEALLEGVAMAGLVGVLRQLGDLAEFAAEIFHDLHEEVMTTAARGHGLMARVQQLEAEVPSIEKAFLSLTNHSSFFSSAGFDWHPNLRTEQNLITRGDLPRFVMDSYEECRGPPRLFLLDKFDVAGAGACLKRYTDPSFFKVEAASSGIATVEVQREKKIRKVKKKGSRWRNGETPEVLPTSHAKLHELFLEERVENGHPDPARIVKLKRRQLTGSPFDLKPGKSYMEKFLEPASPEHKVVCEVSATPSPLKLTLDNSSESGLEILEISTVSPAKKSSHGKEITCLPPNDQELVLKPFMDELNVEAIDGGILKAPDLIADGETDESPTTVHKMAIEEELAVDAQDRTECSLDGDHSDDINSEVDNYMDALTTMDSEMETDNEYKSKGDQVFSNVGKHGVDSDANEEQLYVQANFSDSQSIGNSSLSDGGNSSFKKERSSFSYSDSLSNLADNSPSDSEGTAKTFPSIENCAPEIVDLPSDNSSVHVVEALGTESHEPVVATDRCTEEDKIPDLGEVPCSSGLTDLNPTHLPSVPAGNSLVVSMAGPELDETSSDCIKLGSKSLSADKNGTNLADSSVVLCDISSQTRHDKFFISSSGSRPVDELDNADPKDFSDAFEHTSNLSELAPEKKSSEDSVNEMHQTDYPDEICAKNLVEGKIASPHSTSSSTEEQLPCSALPEFEVDSSVTLLPDGSDVVKPCGLVSEVDDAVAARGVNLEKLTLAEDPSKIASIKEHQCYNMTADASQAELDSTKMGMKLEEIDGAAEGEEMGGLTGNVDLVGGDCVLLKHPSKCSDKPDLDNIAAIASETVQADDVATSATGGANDDVANNVTCPSSDLICSPSRNLTDTQESLSGSEDLHQKGLEFNDVTSPDCLTEMTAQMEIKQLEVASTDLVFDQYKSVSEDYTNLEVIEHLNDSSLAEQNPSSLYVGDVLIAPSSELSNLELESKPTYQSPSVGSSEDSVHSPTCHLPQTGTYSQQSMELQHVQNSAEFVHSDDANSESLNLQASPTCYLVEPGIPSEQSLDLRSDQLDKGCQQADEASSMLLNPHPEQIQTLSHLDQERHLDTSSKQDLPSQELLLQSASQEANAAELAMNPFDSIFPSFGLLPEVNHVNLEAMPPLPPLPPMQWRIGKVQPAPLASQEDLIDQSRDTFPPMQLFTADEKAQPDFPSSGREIMHPSNPFLSLTVADKQRLQDSSMESVGNSLQPIPLSSEMPMIDTDASSQWDCLPLEQTQSLDSFFTLSEIPNERLVHGSPASGESVQASSNPFSSEPTLEHTTSGHDPRPSQTLPIQPLNQPALETGLEAKMPEHGAQNSEGEQGNSPEKSVLPLTTAEEQPQHDSVTLQGETTWSPSTLVLPPTYEVGKPNGNKLPRPRNPLIDAVVAHDKSKLRKVTERVRPQIGPKVDERDSLLEQIRSKSFNLKPAAVTRPSIQGVQGPKTNLKVAAILEKANAIRQALAGSDEDDDSDGWSDT